MPVPIKRGTEKNLRIINKNNIVAKSKKINQIVEVISFGNGYIDVRMSDGSIYRRSGGTISWRYNNPGNLKYGKFARANGVIGKGWGNHSVFPTYRQGRIAKKNLLFSSQKKYHKLSLYEALKLYAPPYDGNSPKRYASFVSKKIGVSIHTKLYQMNQSQREKLLDAMERFEGFKSGKIVRL